MIYVEIAKAPIYAFAIYLNHVNNQLLHFTLLYEDKVARPLICSTDIRSIFGWSQSEPLIRSALPYLVFCACPPLVLADVAARLLVV